MYLHFINHQLALIFMLLFSRKDRSLQLDSFGRGGICELNVCESKVICKSAKISPMRIRASTVDTLLAYFVTYIFSMLHSIMANPHGTQVLADYQVSTYLRRTSFCRSSSLYHCWKPVIPFNHQCTLVIVVRLS